MARLAFSRRGFHVDISRGHQIDSVGGRPSPDRRHRQTPRKGTGFWWSRLLMLGLALVILAFFVLGAWQLSLTTGDEGPSEFPSRLALYRRRSESRLGLRPPRLALVLNIINQCLAVHEKLEASLRDLSRTGDVQSCKPLRRTADAHLKELVKELKPLTAFLHHSPQASHVLPKNGLTCPHILQIIFGMKFKRTTMPL